MGNPGPQAGGGEPVLSLKGEYMRSNGLNHIYRVVWNAARGVWQAIAESGKGHAKSKRSRTARQALAAGSFVLVALPALAADVLPSGGTVVAGALVNPVAVSNGKMTIEQASSKLAMDWQSFSIGRGNTVEFVQPSASAIALNRVLGSDVSVIQGALKANGQVFLINPNGVLFTPSAQVNVGSLVASTQSIKTADFLAGKYLFEGLSSNAIINQGNVTAANGGTIALIAAKIVNDGTLTANGGNVLLGAGSKVTLDMGGPVKLLVENDTLETLISNGGAIRADGGHVLLTSQAARMLASSVINNTGLIEAQTLATGEKGEIVLFAHDGTVNIGGKLDASAPNGGDGGFIETSAATVGFGRDLVVTAAAAHGKAGKWLIDPTDITIEQSTCTGTNCIAADTLATTLAGTDVEIATDAAGTDAGNITVNAPVAWSADTTLTLNAHNNININANLTHTGTSVGGMIFKYGQGSADGGTSAYTEGTGVSVVSPSLQWLKGNETAGIRYAIVDGAVFLGGKFIEIGISPYGYFGTGSVKPSTFYGRNGNNGIGMVGDADGFGTGTDLRIDYFMPGSPFHATTAGYNNADATSASWNVYNTSTPATVQLLPLGGDNVMKAKVTATVGDMQIVQIISLGKTDKYFKTEATLTNTGAAAIANATFVSHFDPDNTVDVGGDYETIQKVEQTIGAGDGAAVVSATSKPGDAYAMLSGGSQSKIIYYSADARATVGQGGDFWNSDGNAAAISAMTSLAASQSKGSTATADDAMGIVFNVGSIAAGASKSFRYLTSLDNRDMSTILAELGGASGVTPSAPVTGPVTGPSVPVDTAIKTAQVLPVEPRTNTGSLPGMVSPTNAPPTEVVTSGQGSLPVYELSGGLAFVALPGSSGRSGDGATPGTTPAGGNLPAEVGGRDPLGFMRVFVVGGGLSLPEGLCDNGNSQNLRRN